MGKQVIFGCSGPVGVALMERLAAVGHDVVGVCRSGSSEAPAGVRIEAGDVADVDAACRLADGAEVVYGCVGIPYQAWNYSWPGIVQGLLAAAEAAGARLVFADNLYCYGPQNRPLTEDMRLTDWGRKPALRAKMVRTMLEAHRVERVRTALVRASDFYGPRVLNSALGERVFPNLLAGKPVWVLGDPDKPHTFTCVSDFARALQTVAEAEDDDYGQAWHVPNAPTRSPREVIELAAELAGGAARIRTLPRLLITLMAPFNSLMGELKEMLYQWERSYTVDHAKFAARFWDDPTPLEEGLRSTLYWYRSRGG